jgi:AcrR family transcriptional regulator
MPVVRKRSYDMTSRAAAAAETRVRILKGAYGLLMQLHFDDVTIAKIAQAAGVSVPTVVLHFKTKEGIVEALVEWWRPQEEALREVPSGDPLEAAQRICARYEATGPAVIRILAIEDRLGVLAKLVEQSRTSHREWVERTFGARLGSGGARARRVMALVAAYDVYTWHVLRRRLDAENTILAMAELGRGVLERGGRR